jgi:5'-3' exonuclease
MRLHVVDGTYELFRAHYSKRPPHASPDGQDVKATVGLVLSMLWLLEDPSEEVTHVGIAFDNPIESFRNDLFEGYKSGAGVEPALLAQFDLVEEAAAAIGITVWSMDRWEADDALATAARRFRGEVEQVRILTPDKDLGQCVSGTQIVQVDRMREKVIDEDGVWQRNGVAPPSIPDYLALVGDTADGIPGVPGFGAKSSSALLAHYGNVETIPDDPDKWEVKVRGAVRLAETLAGMREEVALYKHLATLVEDVPFEESLSDLEWRGVPRERCETLCLVLGSETLRERVHRWDES